MKKKIKYSILIILLIGCVLGVLFGRFYYAHFIQSNTQVHEASKRHVYIRRKSSKSDVYDTLVKYNYLKDTSGFFEFLTRKNYRGRNIVPGKYEIKPGWTNNRLVNHLRAGNGRIETKVVITSTRDLHKLSRKMSRELLIDSASIAAMLSNQDSMMQYGFDEANQLCMFIPNTYFVDWDITERELLDRMYKEYLKFWNSDRIAKAAAMGLSTNEVQTLASLVYWETKKAEDMPMVAGVYVNRINQGIKLQADPTLIFALNDYTIKRVLNKHKEIESPYNTYKYLGLPPGPILIAPIKYIDASLNYTKHEYLFFVAKEDFSGYSYFSKTNAQHERYAKLYRQALDQRKIKK